MPPPPVPLVTPDPWLAMAFNATAAASHDANASGSARSAHGSPAKDWQPVPGLGPLRCYAEVYVDRNAAIDSRPASRLTWFFMFNDARAAAFDRTHKLSVTQDNGEAPRTVVLTGRARDESGKGLYWVCEGEETV